MQKGEAIFALIKLYSIHISKMRKYVLAVLNSTTAVAENTLSKKI